MAWYDRQRVVEFASRTTLLDSAIVSAVLCARDLYRQSVGVDQPRTPLDEELAASMRTKYPALFPADVLHVHFVSPRLQREFIMSEANVDETVVRRVLGADRDYVERRGDDALVENATCTLESDTSELHAIAD